MYDILLLFLVIEGENWRRNDEESKSKQPEPGVESQPLTTKIEQPRSRGRVASIPFEPVPVLWAQRSHKDKQFWVLKQFGVYFDIVGSGRVSSMPHVRDAVWGQS